MITSMNPKAIPQNQQYTGAKPYASKIIDSTGWTNHRERKRETKRRDNNPKST
jgi:hypothetical protein